MAAAADGHARWYGGTPPPDALPLEPHVDGDPRRVAPQLACRGSASQKGRSSKVSLPASKLRRAGAILQPVRQSEDGELAAQRRVAVQGGVGVLGAGAGVGVGEARGEADAGPAADPR